MEGGGTCYFLFFTPRIYKAAPKLISYHDLRSSCCCFFRAYREPKRKDFSEKEFFASTHYALLFHASVIFLWLASVTYFLYFLLCSLNAHYGYHLILYSQNGLLPIALMPLIQRFFHSCLLLLFLVYTPLLISQQSLKNFPLLFVSSLLLLHPYSCVPLDGEPSLGSGSAAGHTGRDATPGHLPNSLCDPLAGVGADRGRCTI